MSDFKTARLSEGFDEVIERVWEPNQVVRAHSHPFAVHALVTAGEMWLSLADRTLYLVAGEATLTLGGKEQALTPGWFSVVPRGTKVGVGRKGRNPAILLSILYGRPCSASSASRR